MRAVRIPFRLALQGCAALAIVIILSSHFSLAYIKVDFWLPALFPFPQGPLPSNIHIFALSRRDLFLIQFSSSNSFKSFNVLALELSTLV
ncbi:hypothetical protein FOXYSP1_13484 [Fusarium oxysporum f. sp. phaseoli]